MLKKYRRLGKVTGSGVFNLVKSSIYCRMFFDESIPLAYLINLGFEKRIESCIIEGKGRGAYNDNFQVCYLWQ